MKRVVISAAATNSPIGNSLEEVFTALEYVQQGISNLQNCNSTHFPCTLAGEVKENGQVEDLGPAIDRKEYFLSQALEQLSGNGSPCSDYLPSERFLMLGMGLDYFNLPDYVSSLTNPESDWLSYSQNTERIASRFADKFDFKGGCYVNVSACVASAQAIGLSYRMLKSSTEKKVVVCGGADSMLNPLHYLGFYKLGALSSWEGAPEEACRPYDKSRSGLVLGEGAALFTMQTEEFALKQEILAEIIGYASSIDGYLVTDPEPNGQFLARAALDALQEADISASQIDCVHLHGTSTLKNDLAETKAMELIFGQRYSAIPVFSMKGHTGHLIAACGTLEMLAVFYSLREQKVPATANFTTADPDIPLRVIKDQPLETPIKYVLKLNAAFGGQNTAFVIKRYGQ